MQVLGEIQIQINEKLRNEEIVIDLTHCVNLIQFKKHLLIQSKLSPNQFDRYLLLIKTQSLKTNFNDDLPFYQSITTDQDLKFNILLLIKQNQKLLLKLQKFTTTSLRKRQLVAKDTKAKNVIEFDKEGQVVRDKLQVLQERPHYKIYPIESDYQVCAFCKSSSRDEELRVKCGPVYGPIRVKNKEAASFVHELCALWTPEIFLDDKNKFKNLGKAIKRCKKLKCSMCKEKGAGLGCFIKNCDKTYHYLCAKLSNCLFVNSKFIIYCEDHRDQATLECLEEEKIEEEQDEQLKHYICSICKSGLDEHHILICDSCDLGFHSNCHRPIVDMESMEADEEWFCHDCTISGQMQKQKFTDRNQNKNSKPLGKKNGFAKDGQYIPKKIPNATQKRQEGHYDHQDHQDDYEEEKIVGIRQNRQGRQESYQEYAIGYSDHSKQSQINGHYERVVLQPPTRGRGRGQYPRYDNQQDPEGFVKRAPFTQRGRGRGRGGNSHQTRDRDFNNGVGFGHPIDFQETKQRTRGRGQRFQPNNYDTQWVQNEEDLQNGYRPYQGPDYDIYRPVEDYYDDEEDQFEEGYIDAETAYQVQANFEQNNNRRQQQDNQKNQQPIKEQVTHNVKVELHQKQILYKDYLKPVFYQGPSYDFERKQTKFNGRQRNQEVHNDVTIQTQEQHFKATYVTKNYQRVLRRFSQEDYDEPFDFKLEKRIENQFWNQEKQYAEGKPRGIPRSMGGGALGQFNGGMNGRGGNKRRQKKNIQEQGNRTYKAKTTGGQGAKKPNNKGGKGRGNNKNGQQRDGHQRGTKYEEHISEEQIKKGQEKGILFEGILRVNQNNRRRAFVTVNEINVDIMIDGLNQQNRALDGDTVIVEILEPSKWSEYVSNNVVIGKDSMGQSKLINQISTKGYTNETAIESRIVDLEVFDDSVPADDDALELKEVRKDFIRHLSEEQKHELSQEEIYDADKLEKAMESGGSDEDVGYGFIDDEQVSSSNDDSEQEEQKEEQVKGSKPNPESSAKAQKNKVYIQKRIDVQLKGETRQERIAEINKIAKDLRPIGKVKAIVKSPNREKEHLVTLTSLDKELLEEKNLGQFIDMVKEKKNATSSGIYAVPVSKKLPWMALFNIPQEFIDDLKSKRKPSQRYYIAKLNAWKVNTIRPACNIISSIGEAGNLDAESLRILKSHDIWSDEYETEGQKISEKVHESLRVFTKDIDPSTGEWKIHEEELKRRIDLRSKRIFTIDPLTAKDLDDALSIDKVSDFIYEIGVHIADVSYFVQQGTDLDKEAQLRCTSVYFVHKVYPMLPRLLCERLCSLNPKVDRLAYSIFFRMDIRTGELDKGFTPRIERTVIRSCAKWHYQLVQDILDGKIRSESQLAPEHMPIGGVTFNDMRNDCFLMNEIAQKRRKKRLDNGSLMLQNREFIFVLDQESRMPVSFQESYRIESKFLVEEYMLLANILIAEHLHQYCRDKTLLRAHPDLDDEKKDKLKQFFEKVGLQSIDLTDSKTLSVSLETLRDSGDSARFNVAMRKFLTCLQCAKYLCINTAEPREYQHYGLNFPLYTHFTSPIRRYADLLVHRLVTLTLQHKEATRDLIELMDYSNYAELCSEKSYNAKRASQQCSRLFHCLLLKSQGIKVFESLLFDIDQGSISIYLDEVNMHQKLRLRDDSRIDSLLFFEEQLTIVAHLKGKKGDNRAEEKRELFKKIKTLGEFEQHFSPEEYLIMRIFDKIKVKVDTTKEFPLDIQCTIMFTKEDLEEYDKILNEQEAKNVGSSDSVVEIAVEEMENLNDEV